MIGVERGLLAPELPLSRGELTRLVAGILLALDLDGSTYDLRVVGDAEIAVLNQDFLGVSGPTNVLSFPAEDAQHPSYLGELAISVDTVRREAFLYGQEPIEHMVRLLAHGLLHLAGLDHGPVMEALTEQAVDAYRQEEEKGAMPPAAGRG